MLAKVVNDNAGQLIHRGALRFFASKLASTTGIVEMNNKPAPHLCIGPASLPQPTGSMGVIKTGESP
ncbi:conserved hypothetical protein [Pseudomonas sp. PM2]|uniref:hypothetical protein n=1 Tax=Pseudomonas lactis TaxID=1615674 RepID=UPI0006F9B49D|nr:hypothetical protein [Pseudomonas lactis]KRD02394.1 hypothetical protein ASE33_17440 [Pseudomonas sp. Root9]